MVGQGGCRHWEFHKYSHGCEVVKLKKTKNTYEYALSEKILTHYDRYEAE